MAYLEIRKKINDKHSHGCSETSASAFKVYLGIVKYEVRKSMPSSGTTSFHYIKNNFDLLILYSQNQMNFLFIFYRIWGAEETVNGIIIIFIIIIIACIFATR